MQPQSDFASRAKIAQLNDPTWTNHLLILIVVITIITTILTLSPNLWDRYQVVKDVQNSYWMARYQEPTLFATDYLFDHRLLKVDIFGSQLILYPRSLGYGLLFYLASFFINHIWLSKWLVFILLPLSVIYLFKIGQHLGNNLTGASLSLIFIFFIQASYQSISPASGLQRGFALPLLIIFLYYLIQQQYVWASLMIVLSALFYWPLFPLTLLTYSFTLIKVYPRFRISLDLAKSFPLLVGFLVSILFAGLELVVEFQAFIPQEVTVLEDPNFQSQGSAPMFISFPWFGRAGIFDAGTDVINFIVLLIFCVFIYRIVGPSSLRRLPGIYWSLLIAAIVMYIASFIVLIGLSSSLLYQPSRYTRVTLFLLALCFVGLNWPEFLNKGLLWFQRKHPLIIFFMISLLIGLGIAYLLFPNQLLLLPLLWFGGLILSSILFIVGSSTLCLLIIHYKQFNKLQQLGMVGLLLVTIVFGVFYIRTLGFRPINPTLAERKIYEFVSTLPEDAILAGEPVIMSGIPLFSQRSVLFRDLHPDINPNASIYIIDYFDAQYAESPDTILDFCQHYKVTHLVLNTNIFTSEYLAKKEFFYQPWNDVIIERVQGRSEFVLPHVKPIFESGPFVVVECNTQTILAAK